MSDKTLQIGKRIKTRREELNLTQEDLGKALNMNKSTIQRYENGKIEKIKLPVLQAMASLLQVNPEWLILKSDEPTSSPSDDLSSPPNEEQQLIELYRQLNPEGQEKVTDYADDLVNSGKYKKSDTNGMVKEA